MFKPALFSARVFVPLTLSAVLLSGCFTGGSVKPEESSLYERLGGKEALTLVVDDFVANVAADTRINGFFAKTDIPHFKMLLVEQLCAGTGGPCTYTGKDMKTTHAGMNINNAQFGALVEDLTKSLDKFKVPAKEQQELFAILSPMQKDIVTAP